MKKAMIEQVSMFAPDSPYGKTFPAPSQATRERISAQSSRRCAKSGMQTLMFLDLRGGGWKPAGCIVGDGYSIAWRMYDAQYWGVPQRRKRIYLVADFASERAGEILFERESVRGNFAQSREAREGTAADAQGSAEGSCYAFHLQQDPIGGSISPCIGGQHQATVGVFMGGQGAKAGSIAYDEAVSPTLRATASGSNRTPDVVYAIEGNSIDRVCAKNGKGYCEDVSPTMNTQDRHAVVYDTQENVSGVAPALTGDRENRVTDYTAICVGNGQLHQTDMGDKTGALNCMHDQQAVLHVAEKPPRKYSVRRLTPLECCRLQGFPDWWEDGVEGSDSARYKMWGNGIALPCAVDVLGRIARAIANGEKNTK